MNVKIGISGYFKLDVVKPDGSVVELAPFQKNLWLDQGLDNFMSSNAYIKYVHVGTGTSTPVITQTSLDSFLALEQLQSRSMTNSGSPPYYTDTTTVHEFAVGVFNGQALTEIGLGRSWAGGLSTRSLIKDAGGAPTSVTVLIDEILRVTYTLRLNVPEVDSVVVLGPYTCTTRAMYANNAGYWGFSQSYQEIQGSLIQLYTNASLGSITANIQGTSVYSSDQTFSRPSARSFRDTANLTLTEGNQVNGISGMTVRNAYFEYAFKTVFSPPIMKTSDELLSLSFDVTWDRV